MQTIEAAVDIVLHVLKNSHRKVCSEVFSRVVACQHGICCPQIFRTESSFLEVLYRSSCSLINAVIKYLNFHTSTSKLGSKLCYVCVCVQSFFCVCSKFFFCVFKVIYVCSKLIVNSTVMVFVGELEIRTSHLEVFCKLVFLTFF